MEAQERRSTSAPRVAVETLVEMCGLSAEQAPAFEAESINVSGRGMHVRTAYLPEVGMPLVCRFEHRGHEIIVEGSVAWRRDGVEGGEFGLRFTAVDSGSVEALKELCGLAARTEPSEPAPTPPDPDPDPEPGSRSPEPPPSDLTGTRVKLHIDGLGSPMRARVREGSKRRVHVGSNLEFLAVGRSIELENLDHPLRRTARIDAVEVVIDPQSQVPQLVVALHYDDVDQTPEPSVVDTEVAEISGTPVQPFGIDATVNGGLPALESAEASIDEPRALTEDPPEAADEDPEEDPEEELSVGTPLPVRWGRVAAKNAGAIVSRLQAGAAGNVRRAVLTAGSRVDEFRQKRAAAKAPRRVTAEHPDGPLSVEGARLRPQARAGKPLRRQGVASSDPDQQRSQRSRRAKRVLLGAAGVALLGTVGIIALGSPKEPPGAEQAAQPSAVEVSVANEDVTNVDEQGNPIPKTAKVSRLEEPKPSSTGIVADVPLFGPTPLATMEPAPLGPSPEEAAEDETKAPAASKAAVADESFDDQEAPVSRKHVDPKDVKPWGRGTMHRPIIHRLRLDAPGGAIQGAILPTGFSVVVPERKVMESGKAIAKRDKRIARLKTQNTSSGAQLTFNFRGAVPGYRVRLRKDFVEILISSPKE